jgi:MFS family permease
MRSITRETIIDRRLPVMRWSAVFAGTSVSVALWVLFQVLGFGIGFAALDAEDTGSLRAVAIGTTVWTFAAPFVAMFIGGFITGRLSGTGERKVGAMHGFVMWALTSLLGLFATVLIVSMLAESAAEGRATATLDVSNAADATGRVLLGLGASSAVALLMAVLGGAVGVRRHTRHRLRHDTVRTEPVPPPPPSPVVIAPSDQPLPERIP